MCLLKNIKSNKIVLQRKNKVSLNVYVVLFFLREKK